MLVLPGLKTSEIYLEILAEIHWGHNYIRCLADNSCLHFLFLLWEKNGTRGSQWAMTHLKWLENSEINPPIHHSEVAVLLLMCHAAKSPFISTWLLPLYSFPWLLSLGMLGPSWLGEELALELLHWLNWDTAGCPMAATYDISLLFSLLWPLVISCFETSLPCMLFLLLPILPSGQVIPHFPQTIFCAQHHVLINSGVWSRQHMSRSSTSITVTS